MRAGHTETPLSRTRTAATSAPAAATAANPVRSKPDFLVELRGFEPLTSAVLAPVRT
jgi:hypothetical protein